MFTCGSERFQQFQLVGVEVSSISTRLIGRADIEFCHPVVGKEISRGPRKHHPALIKDATAMADGQRLSGALFNHKYGNSLSRQLDHQVEYLLDQRWRQSCS